jgi:hypothetical protein
MARELQHLKSWQAPEFKHYHKNFGWHTTFWIIVIFIVIYQIVSKDIFGAISVFLIALFATYLLKQRPEEVTVSLSNHGLHIDDLHVPYKNMKHFWIVDTENHRTLNIETTAYLNRLLIIEIEDQNPEDIREILISAVPEHESTEPTAIQQLMHYLRM